MAVSVVVGVLVRIGPVRHHSERRYESGKLAVEQPKIEEPTVTQPQSQPPQEGWANGSYNGYDQWNGPGYGHWNGHTQAAQ